MKHVKRILAVLLALCFVFAVGCAKGPIKTMRNYLKDNGVYDAENGSYKIELTNDIDYFCYKNRDNVRLSCFQYSSGKYMSFYITFDNEGLEDLCYDYAFYYGSTYSLIGHIYPEFFDANTDSLTYDYSDSELGSAYENSLLAQLAASYARMVLAAFKNHLSNAGYYVTPAELGFVNF